jgi:hypothetical protein
MLPLDSYEQKRIGNRPRRSEAGYRLYWSTYQKMADQAPAPRRKSQVWMGVPQLFGALRSGWHTRVQTDMRVSEQGPQTPQFITEEGKV